MNPSRYGHRLFLARFGLWGTCLVPGHYSFARRGVEPQCWTCDKSTSLYICRMCGVHRKITHVYMPHDCVDYIMCIPCFKTVYEDALLAAALAR